MNIVYRKADMTDLELLVQTRLEVLRAANGLGDGVDMTQVEIQSRRYYQEALPDGRHTAYLVFDGGRLIGAGGVSYYEVMPTWHNPTGQKAYVMNMYTVPEYRRRGIATRTLELLLADAEARGIVEITLEATRAGRPLYERFGFVPMVNELELPAQKRED